MQTIVSQVKGVTSRSHREQGHSTRQQIIHARCRWKPHAEHRACTDLRGVTKIPAPAAHMQVTSLTHSRVSHTPLHNPSQPHAPPPTETRQKHDSPMKSHRNPCITWHHTSHGKNVSSVHTGDLAACTLLHPTNTTVTQNRTYDNHTSLTLTHPHIRHPVA